MGIQIKNSDDSSCGNNEQATAITGSEKREAQMVSTAMDKDMHLNKNFEFEALKGIRNRLLDLTGRNRLLNFKHGKSGFIRVIDEMPNQLAENILDSNEFIFIPSLIKR